MKTKLIKPLLAFVVLFVSMPMNAFEVDGIKYSILSEEDRTVVVGEQNKSDISGVINIQKKIIHNSKTYTVTNIGEWAFGYCSSLTQINIPNSVTSIGESAFSGCTSLTQVNIPNSVTYIGGWAFDDCTSLTQVSIPDSVTSIGSNAFKGCKSLTQINIPNSVTSIGDRVFSWCSSLTQVNIPNSVTSIGEDAFRNCSSLSHINIPNSVTSIGHDAFLGCTSLTKVDIPNSVTSISGWAFGYCSSLTAINVEENNPTYSSMDGVLYSKDKTTLIQYPEGKKTETFDIPNTVTNIGYRAFYGCKSLTQIDIPNSVTSIGEVAFFSCESLTQVSIPNSVTSIGVQAFDYSNALNVIYNMCDEPIECNPYFPDVVLMEATLYVPKGSLAAYEKVDPWRNFWHIEEMDFSGIEDVNSNTNSNITVNNGTIVVNGYAGEVEVFNTSGQLIYRGNDTYISNLNKGIYIVKAGTNVTKVAL